MFAGIGGIRNGFEAIGGQCVFTSEWNKHAVRTYKANWYCDPHAHHFNEDIRDVTLSHKAGVSDAEAAEHIRQNIPQHDVLLAGFPCQPFSLAGVSKKNALGRAHGFACDTRGTLFLMLCGLSTPVARRFCAGKRQEPEKPRRRKNLPHYYANAGRAGLRRGGCTGYGADDPKIIDGKHFLPQHRERIVLVGFRRDLNLKGNFTLRDIPSRYPAHRPSVAELLEPVVDAKFILTPVLWKYLYRYAKKHQAKATALVSAWSTRPIRTASPARCRPVITRTGPRSLIDRGWDKALGEVNFDDPENQRHRPRRLTPRECARLMGFESPQGYRFRIPVSDTRAYRQFGNSVVVPAFAAVAKLLESRIQLAVKLRLSEAVNDGCAQ